jgi:hypothetical protein
MVPAGSGTDMQETDDIRHDKGVLEPLVERTLRAAGLPVQEERKRLWADHQALWPTAKIPVCVYYEGIPVPQWEAMLGLPPPACRQELARSIEFDLRRVLWMADHVPDDHIVWPSIIVDAATMRPESWGIPLSWEGSRPGVDDPLEARRIVAPFSDGMRLERLVFSDIEMNAAETRRRTELARELTGGKMAVHVRWPDLGHSPFDIAARICGLENLLLWCADRPDQVGGLMGFLTRSHLAHHERREREGRVNCHREGEYARVGFRVHCWRPSPGTAKGGRGHGRPEGRPGPGTAKSGKPTLADEWAYISAQTSSGLGPRQYAELVQPSSEALAAPFTKRTVYYHGCECLDGKIDSIVRIPNLRRFHVSPWSSVEVARRKLRGTVVLEVHANPSEVFFGATREDIRRGLRRLVDAGEGIPMDLNLSDIHSVNGRPGMLAVWAEEAQEVS